MTFTSSLFFLTQLHLLIEILDLVVHTICSFLPGKDLARVARVSKEFFKQVSDESLWERALCFEWGNSKKCISILMSHFSVFDFKSLFKLQHERTSLSLFFPTKNFSLIFVQKKVVLFVYAMIMTMSPAH